MEMLTALTICEGNPPVTGEFSSERTTNMECWNQAEQAVEQTAGLQVIWDTMGLIWDTVTMHVLL